MMTFRPFNIAPLLIGIAVLIQGCTLTSAPLISPKFASVDPALLGSWIADDPKVIGDDPKSPDTITFKACNEVGLPSGLMICNSVKHPASQSKPSYFVTCPVDNAMSPNYRYISSFQNSSVGENEKCSLCRYIAEKNSLRIWTVNDKEATRLIKTGTVNGDATNINKPILDKDSLIAYLQSNTGEKLFGVGSSITFHRAPGSLDPSASTASANPGLQPPTSLSTESQLAHREPGSESSSSGLSFWIVLPWTILAVVIAYLFGKKVSAK